MKRLRSAGASRLHQLTGALLAIAPWWLWAALVVATTLFILHTYATYPQFAPDSRFYGAMAHHFSGLSQEEARDAIADSVAASTSGMLSVDSLFNNSIVDSRVLYPALSAPFVKFMGMSGMLVIPVVSTLFLVLTMFGVIAKRYGRIPALLVVGLYISGYYMMFFSTAMLTEGLAAALGVGVMLTLPIWNDRSWVAVAAMVVLLVALAYTRQASLIPTGAVVFAWIGYWWHTRKLRNRWAPFALAAVVTTLAARAAQSTDGGTDELLSSFDHHTGGSESWGGYPVAFLRALGSVILRDLQRFARWDQAFLILLGIAWLGALLLIKRIEAHLFLGAMAAGGIINGLSTIPVSFRYEMPGLAFLLLVAGAVIKSRGDRLPRLKRHWAWQVPSTATEPTAPTAK